MKRMIQDFLQRRKRRPFFMDRDARSAVAIKQIKWLVLIVVLSTTGIVLFISGQINLNLAKSISSTDYGTSLSFTRSNATWTMGNIFTDKSKDMLVVQLNSDSSSNLALPADGKDYKVFLGDKTCPTDTIPISFGRFGTDGSMYLFIPNPKQNFIYNIFIRNQKYLQQQIVTSQSGNTVATIDDSDKEQRQSITDILSQTATQGNVNVPNYQIASNNSDLIGFRVTLTSSSKYTAANKTITLSQPFVKNGKMDYASFFDQIMQKRSVSSLQKQLENYKAQEPNLKTTLQEYQNRLKSNPNDSDAKQGEQNIQQELQTLNQDIAKTQGQITAYKEAKFKPDYFSNVQTKAEVVRQYKLLN